MTLAAAPWIDMPPLYYPCLLSWVFSSYIYARIVPEA